MVPSHLGHVLITGATGTLGYNTVRHLGTAHPETHVHVLMRTLDPVLFADLPNVTLEQVDMADFPAVQKAVANCSPNAVIPLRRVRRASFADRLV